MKKTSWLFLLLASSSTFAEVSCPPASAINLSGATKGYYKPYEGGNYSGYVVRLPSIANADKIWQGVVASFELGETEREQEADIAYVKKGSNVQSNPNDSMGRRCEYTATFPDQKKIGPFGTSDGRLHIIYVTN